MLLGGESVKPPPSIGLGEGSDHRMSPSVSEVCKYLTGSTLHFPVNRVAQLGRCSDGQRAGVIAKVTLNHHLLTHFQNHGPTHPGCLQDFLPLSTPLCVDLNGISLFFKFILIYT